MHPILLYLLKMLICSGMLYGYYRIALYNERFHQWNRFYLLGTLLLSIVLPLIKIPLLWNAQPTTVIYVLDAMPWNASAATTAATPESAQPSVAWVLGLMAALVSLILAGKLLISIYKICRDYRQASKTNFEDVQILITQEPSAPYSFFNWLFWRSDMDVESTSGKRMLQHELTHIRQKHTFDKLLMELVLICCWMNPIFWLIRKELYIIHEFLADQKAIEKNNGTAFAEMILQSMHIHPTPALANPFFTSQIKRRLFMITSSHNNQFSYIKRLFTLAIILGTIFIIACTSEKKEFIKEDIEIPVIELGSFLTTQDPKNYKLPEGMLIFLDGKAITLAEMQKLNPDLLEYDLMLNEVESAEKYGSEATNGAYELYSIKMLSGAGVKENLPSFPGGQKEWTTYLQKNLRYPDDAIDNGTMGMVQVAFTVLPDGSIKDVKAINDPGDGLAEESVRIIKKGPKWVPGKVKGEAVEQRVIQAITFRLE